MCFHAGLDEVNADSDSVKPYFIVVTWSNKLDNEVNGYGFTQKSALNHAKAFAKAKGAKIDRIDSVLLKDPTSWKQERVPSTVSL